jgi:hypothetical protein
MSHETYNRRKTMTDFEKDNVKQLVARLKEIQKQSDVTIPGWMLDENRYGKGPYFRRAA